MKHAELKSMVIAGFSGIGKTTVYHGVKKNDLSTTMIDLDINDYKNDLYFPQKYIAKIKECSEKYAVILVDAGNDIRKAMRDAGIFYCIIYPDMKLMSTYMARYTHSIDKNLSSVKFIDTITDIEKDLHPKVRLNGKDIFLTKELVNITMVKAVKYFQNYKG